MVNAQDNSSLVEIKTVNVYPEKVEGEGWENLESITFQNLDSFALYQEFNKINSTYPNPSKIRNGTTAPNTDSQNNSSDQSVVEPSQDQDDASVPSASSTPKATTSPSNAATSGDAVSPEQNDEDGPDASDEDEAQPEFEVPPEDSEELDSGVSNDVESDTTSTTAIRTDRTLGYYVGKLVKALPFTFADSELTDADDQIVVVEDTVAESDADEDVADAESDQEESENLSESIPTQPEVEAVEDDDISSSTDTLVGEDTSSSSSNASETNSADAVTTPSPNKPASAAEEDDTDAVAVTSCVDTGCPSYAITLSGFGVPIFDEQTEFSGAQLRLSFAAKRKVTRDVIQSLKVQFSLDGETNWQSAGDIIIDDEASNSLNGGYYLFSLPTINDSEVLDKFAVRLVYDDDLSELEGLFVESVWLELFATSLADAGGLIQNDLLTDNNFFTGVLSGDELELPNGEKIEFNNTDENTGETLIIKSDKENYAGLSQTVTYFNVTNTSDAVDTFSLQTHFPKGVGEVVSLDEWQPNKPKEVVVPEFRPFVYHCEAGWEYSGAPISTSLEDLSRLFVKPKNDENNAAEATTTATTTEDGAAESEIINDFETGSPTMPANTEPEIESAVETNSSSEPVASGTASSLPLVGSAWQYMQAVFDLGEEQTEATSSATLTGSGEFVLTDPAITEEQNTASSTDATDVDTYMCRNTSIVRACDSIEGDNTFCRVENEKVAEHRVTRYEQGWGQTDVAEGEMAKPGFFGRIKQLIGLAPDKKPVPDKFEVRSHSADTYDIAPGETKYFKMEIAFPPFSTGEFWIEAVGDSEYGLLDPFWSSQWTYRMPITIDNTLGTEDLTEHQVFLELDNTLTDFWTNVAEDGSDIRFVAESPSNVEDWFGVTQISHDWYDFDWSSRVAVTIQASEVDDDLSDFPVFIDLSDLDSAFFAGVESDGADIRVTTADGQTELPFELVDIDTGAETGELHFKADSLSSTSDTDFYIYYGNSGASAYASTDTYGSENVWTNGYEAVYHFANTPTGSAGDITDSTGNNDGTSAGGMDSGDMTTGRMGGGYDFGGGSAYELVFPDLVGGNTAVTVSYWLLNPTYAVDGRAFSSGDNANNMMAWPDNAGSGHFDCAINGTGNRAVGTLNPSGWVNHTCTWNGSTIQNYVNSTPDGSDTLSGGSINTDTENRFGRDDSGEPLTDIADELRIMNVAASAEWVSTEYNNQNSPATFYTASASEGAPDLLEIGTWLHRVPITIQASEVDAPLTDFPVYVNLADLGSEFFAMVQSDGDDIRITEDDGQTELPYELVGIDTGSGSGELYFRAPSLSDTVDTTFYLYFGNVEASGYGPTDEFGSQNVWVGDYEAVLHFEESPGGSAPQFMDSTGNGHNGTVGPLDAGNQLTGPLGNAVDYNGTDEYSVIPGFTGLGTSNQPYGMGIWFNADSGETDGNIITMSAANPPGSWNLPPIMIDNDNIDGFSWIGSDSRASGVTPITQGDWYQTYTTWSAGDGLDIYLNGSVDGNVAQGIYTASGASNFLHLARSNPGAGGGNGFFNGKLDELRVYNDTVSAEWIDAEFTNMDTPSTFYATSTLESMTPTSFTELDFWIQHFSTTTEESDIWVQVDTLPAGASTTIYLYYGNGASESASDEYATFTHTELTDTYYVVDDVSTGDIEVYSLIDNNQVQLDNGTITDLNAGETVALTGYSGSSIIRTLGPISATINDVAADAIVPISFASTTFAIPTSRNTSAYYVYAPFATSSVQTYIGSSATPDESFTVPKGAVVTSNTDANGSSAVIIEASEPVLVYHLAGNDSFVPYPPTTRDLYGIDTNTTQMTTLTDNPDPSIYCSGGSSNTVTGISRGESQASNVCSQGADGSGDSVRLTDALFPIAVIQQADGDGNESSFFLPQHEFATEYYLPTDTAYIAVACSPRFGAVTLEVQTSSGASVEAGTCTPSGQLPGKAYFVNGGNGDTLSFTAGHKIVSTNGVPFYAMYEDDEEDNDETNVWGSVQGRKFSPSSLTAAFGAQEITIDAEYEQLSYGWYENIDAETPTSKWPIDGVGDVADEGEPISSQGAINLNDVLRLRMNLLANNATGTVNSTAFKLQYAEGEICTDITEWSDVGALGSSTAAFRGYNNASVNDGTLLSSTTLASSTAFGTYEEQNLSSFLQTQIDEGEVAEWDWVIENNGAAGNATYCFRMVRETGVALSTYTSYPQLETAGPPLPPTLSVFFDNERTANFAPVLEFVTTDTSGDDIHYQVQVDEDINFGSVDIERDSIAHYSDFENLASPADKSPFDNGAPVRFTSFASLSATSTYWWRVRGRDPDGSDTWGEWSSPFSFSTDGSVTVSEWHQTTGNQFSTNALTSLATSSGAVSVSGSNGTMVSTAIDFDDATVGNAWGEVSWNDTETSGTILYQVQYRNGSSWVLVPDTEIPSNSSGNGSSPINILGLDPEIYNEIRLVANFSGATLSIQDWTVTWGERVETPSLGNPFDNEKVSTTTPTFSFVSTDPQGDDLEYEISYGTDSTFTSSTTVNSSSTPTGWSGSGPFTSGDTVTYTIPSGSALTDGVTYWWRSRAKDPTGSDAWSPWSDADSFTIDTSVTVSTWFQTTDEQFDKGTLSRTDSVGDEVVLSTALGKIAVYREATGGDSVTTSVFDHNWDTTVHEDDIYSLSGSDIMLDAGYYAVMYGARFDSTSGTNRSEIQSYLTVDGVNAPIGWSQGYIRRTGGTDEAFTSGGGIVEIENDGDALALHSFRTDANAAGVARAANTAGINVVRLDPTWPYLRLGKDTPQAGPTGASWLDVTYDRQDEIDVDVYEHTGGSGNVVLKEVGHYLVFANTYGAITTNDRSQITQRLTLDGVDIEGSYTSVYVRGDQNSEGTFEGAAAIGMIIETTGADQELNVELTRDQGSTAFTINEDDTAAYVDRTALTIVKLPEADFIRLTDSGADDMNPATLSPMGWDTEAEVSSSFVHSTVSNDERVVIDIDGDYLFFTSLYGLNIGGTQRKYYNQGWRVNGGSLLGYGQTGNYDRETAGANDAGNFSGIVFPGLTDGDYVEVVTRELAGSGAMAADFKGIQGLRINSLIEADTQPVRIESPDIVFTDGLGPKWGEFSWNDTRPGTSTVSYQVAYLSAPNTYSLIPDVDLPGNSSGFTSGPVDLSDVDVGTYGTLRLRATFSCDGVDCPSLQDWTLEWTEGTTVSGMLKEYDRTTDVSGGNIRVAVNGVLTGSTGNVASGATSVSLLDAWATGNSRSVSGGSDRLLVVAVYSESSGSTVNVNTVTYGGQPLTEINDVQVVTAFGNGTWLGYLDEAGIAAAAGTTITPTWVGGTPDDSIIYSSAVFENVNQSNPVRANSVNTGTATNTISPVASVPVVEGDMMIYVGASGANTVTHTPSAGYTEGTEQNASAGTGQVGVSAYKTIVSDGTEQPTATWSGSANRLTMIAASIVPVAGGAQGTWSVNNVTAFAGDVITVFVDDAAEEEEAAAVFVYDGSGDMTGVELFEQHLSLSADENATTTNAHLASYDNSVSGDEDIFFEVNASNDLSVCAVSGCGNANLYIGSGNVFIPDTTGSGNVTTHDFINDGRVELDANTMRVGGSWDNNSSFVHDTSTVIFTATSTPLDTSSWYDLDWGYRVPITIQASQVDSTLTDFPVYVDLADFDSSFFSNLNSDGGDIRITTGDGVTEVAREVVSASTTAETGELHFNAPSISSSTDTTFYMYYGNALASDYATSDPFGAENVWNDSFEAVYHLSETGSTYVDSTSNNNDGAGEGTDPSLVTGKIGGGQSITAGRIDIGTGITSGINSAGEYMLSAWVNHNTSVGDQAIISQYDNAGDILFWGDTDGAGDGYCHFNGTYMPSNCADTNVQTPGTWQQVVARYDGANGYVYVNGAAIGSGAQASTFSIDLAKRWAIGSEDGDANGRQFNGLMDEVRILSADLGADWISAEHRNIDSPSTFYTVDPEESQLTAITSTETLDDADNLLDFYHVTFGETSGDAEWVILDPLDVNRDLRVQFGTLDRSEKVITIARNLNIGANGFLGGTSTTTFDGSTAGLWTDNNATKQNVGVVVIDGTTKTVTLGSSVRAETVTIGSDDTLNGGGTRTLSISGNFTNNNTFTPQTSTIEIVGTSTTAVIHPGTSSLYNLTNSSVGSNVWFDQPNVTLLGSLTIATGTITMPTGVMTIGGSFLNTGGNFAHNNASVVMNSSAIGRSVTQNGTPFLNAFYNLSFTGSGAWSFTDTNATTTNNFGITNGSVTLPSGLLTVGADFNVSGGSFAHNNGEVLFLITDSDTVTTNGSSFNNTRFKAESSAGTWYDLSWQYRLPIVIDSGEVPDDQTDFPVYVDLADLGTQFFDEVNADGSDIRVTESDGVTEVAREVVLVSTGTETGELYFKATSLSSTTNSVFYIYYGNNAATDYAPSDPFGAEEVWTEGFEAVLHYTEDPSGGAPQMLDSTGNGHNGTSLGPDSGDIISGIAGNAVDHNGSTDRVRSGGFTSLGTSNQAYTIGAWFNADVGDTNGAIVHVSSGDTGAGWCLPLLSMNGDAVRGIGWIGSQVTAQGTTNITQGIWNQAYTSWDAANGLDVYLNGGHEANTPQGTFTASGGSNYIHTAFDPPGCGGDNGGLSGGVDEVRIYDERKPASWIATEYNNMSATGDFYSVGTLGLSPARIFSDTNTTILGDVIIESGTVRFPTGVLSVGGSLDNNDTFDHANGTVRFNSIADAETIAAGDSPFGTLSFDSVAGDWTITEHATATNAINLVSAGDFTVDSGLVLESAGTFSNAAANASTTWTGAILKLSSGSSYTLNAKTNGGDDYDTLQLVNNTDINMWNSSASTYSAAASSSIYSQDHDGNDGDLYIFGDYERASGTEYWTYATDFDGTALNSTTSRPVDVRFANNAIMRVSSTTLLIAGSPTASTTIDAQSGSFSFLTRMATVTAEYFEMTGTDADGMQLLGSTTVTMLDHARFTIPAASAAITVDATTVDTNPSSQFFNTDFVTGGGDINVRLSGTPSSYWWFRDGQGDRYGEAFDDSDGDPGSIRWDDSNYQIDISGQVFSDDGVTTMGGPTCDGVTDAVTIVVDGGAYTDSVPCSGANGAYAFADISYNGDPSMVVYLNDAAGGETGSVITRTPITDITNLDIYANRVMTRHEDLAPMTIAYLTAYDEDDDVDLRFVAATGTPDTLIVRPDAELMVASSTTFVPGGNITLQSGGSGNGYDGSLHLHNNATFIAGDTEAHSIGGSLYVDDGATFTTGSSTYDFTATTSGKTITASTTLTFNDIDFVGVGGGWNINTDLVLLGDMNITTGTVTGTGDITLENGAISGNGLLSMGGGTVTIEESSTYGGTQGWTFNNLTFGSGIDVGTTTPASTATTTVLGTLTIAAAHVLDAGASLWDLAGSGTVFVETGMFVEGTSRVTYSGTAATNVHSTNYHDLTLAGIGGTPSFVFGVTGVNVLNNLVVAGVVSSIADLNTNDTVVQVDGNVSIGTNGVLAGSDTMPLVVLGNWNNDGTFVSNNGQLTFDSGDAFTIAAGASSFGDVLISAGGAASVTEHATSSGTWTLASTSDFTVDPGVTLAVGDVFTNGAGGGATTWTGSTLHLFGGDYEVNASTTSDTYNVLLVGPSAEVRMWNSVASTTNVTGSLYSMDHAGVDGDLYIYGNYSNESRNDYWSYATDFDGTDLSGGNERTAEVYIVDNSDVVYTGGSLTALGDPAATTTIQNQGTGTYSLTASGTAMVNWQYVLVRDVDADGVTFAGTPTITDFSHTDHLAEIETATMISVEGTVIDQNPGQNFNANVFNNDTGVTNAANVTLSGTAGSGWRFTGHSGNRDGESFDVDSGNPGEIIWDDSDPIFSISGRVYQSNRSTVSTVCDDTTTNIFLAIDGSVVQNASTSCSSLDGSYSISDISFDANDTLTVFIDNEAVDGVTVTVDSVGSISDMHIYESHVIVRSAGASPITIADIDKFDVGEDADIPYTTTLAPDTLTLDPDTTLLVWTNKDFAPQGNITTGGGADNVLDGTVELLNNAELILGNGQAHSFGGNLTMGVGATFNPAQSTVSFTSSGAGRTVDTNEGGFYNLTMSGSGDFTFNDANLPVGNDFTLSSADVTLPTGTTTISGSLTTTGGSFDANGGAVVFNSTAGETVSVNGSDFNEVLFAGSGSWTMSDSNATATASFRIATGTVTLPSGVLTVGGDFINLDTLIHNSGVVRLTQPTGTNVVTLSSNDLNSLVLVGGATTTMTDASAALLGDLLIQNGALNVVANTLSIAGSLDATGGVMNTATGTILFNSHDSGETINPGNNHFYNVVVGASGGGWTLRNATTTNNFTLASADTFTMTSGETLHVGGVFTNNVDGADTTWAGSTLRLDGQNEYTINTKTAGGDQYENLIITENSQIRAWDSSAVALTIASSSSLYSQDHAGASGALNIYGDFAISTTTEHWSYATDFDGATLVGGSRRAVTVSIADGATTTVSNTGALNIVGDIGATTTIQNQGSGHYSFNISGGSVNFNRYAFSDVNANGINFSGTPTVTSLSNGSYELSVDTGSAITLATSTLNANPSLSILNTGFAITAPASTGVNVNLAATTTNAWTFRDHYGDLDGESFDVDGVTDCGSIRWDDSSCLLTEQTNHRWRHDDGGLGVPDSEWYDTNWDQRKRVRVVNNDNQSYTDTAVEIIVSYDNDMESDFNDLRFTDSDGTTEIDYWIERHTSASEASIWIEVPSLPANETATFFMYYGNGAAATTTSSSTAVFDVIDDFEDNSLSEYSGQTTAFQTDTGLVFGGSYSLEAVNPNGFSNGTMARFDQTVSQGEIIRYRQYISDPTTSSDEICTLFGVQSPASLNDNYAVCLELFGTDRMSIVENAVRNDTYGGATQLSSTNVNYTSAGTGWYEVEIDWQTNNTIDVSLYAPSGSLLATTSATDATYTSGGYGYTFWTNNGAWDSITSRARVETHPSVFFGAEQSDGGATWAGAENSAVSGFEVGDVARLRVAIENTGLDVTGELITVEYAPKGTAPSCGAVSSTNFDPVPVISSCGTSAICMATSSFVSDGESTTDLLNVGDGTFTAGAFVEDPSYQTGALDIDQGEYTEVEYALQITPFSSDDAYCFRVSDNGTEYDSYETIAELSLQFAPSIGVVTLNGGENISLLPGTTTRVYATTTVTDLNGAGDIDGATTTFYHSVAGAACVDDPNNCYIATKPASCSYTGCVGNSCTLECYADFFYFASSTDSDGGSFWYAFMEASDQQGGVAFGTSPGTDVNTLNALSVDDTINYGALEVASSTGSYNPTTTVQNIGNNPIDINVEGSNLTDGGSSVIPADQQRFATSSFDYDSCTNCTTLSTTTITGYELDLTKPTATNPPVADEIYWGIEIPFGVASNPHTGVNTFYAVTD